MPQSHAFLRISHAWKRLGVRQDLSHGLRRRLFMKQMFFHWAGQPRPSYLLLNTQFYLLSAFHFLHFLKLKRSSFKLMGPGFKSMGSGPQIDGTCVEKIDGSWRQAVMKTTPPLCFPKIYLLGNLIVTSLPRVLYSNCWYKKCLQCAMLFLLYAFHYWLGYAIHITGVQSPAP